MLLNLFKTSLRVFIILSLGVVSANAAVTSTTAVTPAGQKIGFMSSNPVTFQQLKTKRQLLPQPVWGFLTKPTNPSERKLPVVIMMAGSGGLTTWYSKYVAALNNAGIATFEVDSFTPRGINEVASNQAQLPIPMLVADAYNALQYLAKEPGIDAHKIAVMGWSLGGTVSLTTAFADLSNSALGKKLQFAAHVALYPACNFIYPNTRLDGAPWLYLHGGADDYTQPTDCLNLINKERNATVIDMTLYPNAEHAFDEPQKTRWDPDVQNPKNCYGIIAADWSMTEKTTGMAINTVADYQTAYSSCMLRGAHLGFNQQASDDALWRVTQFLQRNLIN